MAEFHELDEADDILGTISPHQETDDFVEDGRPKERRAIPPHLIDLYNRSSAEITQEQQVELAEFLTTNAHVNSTDDGNLGRTNVVEYQINTGDSPPVKQRPRRLPRAKVKEADQEVEKMLKR